jgi:hypothetical protein
VDAFLAAALDSAARVLRHIQQTGELPADTLPEQDLMAGWLPVCLDNAGLPPGTGTLDAFMAWCGLE